MVSKVVTQVGVLEEGVQVVQPNSTSAATGVPIGSQQVLGNDGSGNIAPVNLVAGTGMTIAQTGSDITFESTGGSAPSGTVGVYSPVNLVEQTIPSDITIVSVYTSDTPTLAQMDTIATIAITPKYDNDGQIGSSIIVEAIIPYYCDPAQDVGIQLALFSSADSFTTPVVPAVYKQNGSNPNSITNAGGISFVFNAPSTAGETVTFSVGAARQAGLTMIVEAAGFSLEAQEDVPNTQSVVSTTYLTNTVASSPVAYTQDYPVGNNINTTTVLQFNIPKNNLNSIYKAQGTIKTVATSANTNYAAFLYLGFSSSPAFVASTSTYKNVFPSYSSNSFPTTPTTGTEIETCLPVEAVFYPTSSAVNTASIAFMVFYQSGLFTVPINGVNVVVQEVLNLAGGGIIYIDTAPYNRVNVSTIVSTLNPTYSETVLLTQLSENTRAANSLIKIYGIVSLVPQSVQQSAGVVFCFYTSNDPAALPIATCTLCSSGISGVYDSVSKPFKFFLSGLPVETDLEIYATAALITSGASAQECAVFLNYEEIFIGDTNVSVGLTDVTTAQNSYLSSLTAGTVVELDTTPCTTSQAGLVTANAPIAQNSLVQQGATSAVGCVLQSSDSTVIITPSEGNINLSSPLNISTAGSPLLPVKQNNLLFSSIAPTIEWQADYISAGNSTGSKKNVFDSAGTFTQNYTATSSQISLGEWTRFTATTTSPPSANTVSAPQWVCCMQPLPVTALKARAIEILVSSYLTGGVSTQALAYGKGGLMSYTIAVNMTTTDGVSNFVAATPFPFYSNSGGSEGVPTVADQPVNLLFEIVPAASSPSAQFTTGNVVVMSAQWILSATAGITVSFDISLKALF